jgi:hypothetical protein
VFYEDGQGRVWMIQDDRKSGIEVRLTGRGFEDERTAISTVADCGNVIVLRAAER